MRHRFSGFSGFSRGLSRFEFFLSAFFFSSVFFCGAISFFGSEALADTEDVLCTDVGFYDLQNSVISVEEDQALAPGPTASDALPFKNGTCELKDNPNAPGPDWRYEIAGDFILRPTSSAKVRIAKIFESHLSDGAVDGSARWIRLMAFMCHGGRLTKIWQHRFPGDVIVKRVNEIQFRVTPVTKPRPKARKNPDLGLYQWDNKRTTFFKR